MKTSCSSWSYHRTIAQKRMDLLGFIDTCAEIGLDGVELLWLHFPASDRTCLRSVKHACARRFLDIAMLSVGGHLTTDDDARREKDVAEILQWIEIAVYLGAPRIRFFAGSGAELAAGGPALYDKVLDAMGRIADKGREEGVIVALENHGGTTADQLLAFRRDMNHPWFAFTLDTGNFPPTSAVGPETYAAIERTAPFASIVHAKFFNVLPDGRDRDFDWPRIHRILRAAGFNGYLSVEYEGKDDDELGAMKRIASFLKTLR